MAIQVTSGQKAQRSFVKTTRRPAREMAPMEIVGRMAKIMRERRKVFGACTEGDLEASGFTAEHIRKFSAAARVEAAKHSEDE